MGSGSHREPPVLCLIPPSLHIGIVVLQLDLRFFAPLSLAADVENQGRSASSDFPETTTPGIHYLLVLQLHLGLDGQGILSLIAVRQCRYEDLDENSPWLVVCRVKLS